MVFEKKMHKFTAQFLCILSFCRICAQITGRSGVKRFIVPVGNLNRTHFTGKIPVYTNETSLIVPPSTISLRFARLSS